MVFKYFVATLIAFIVLIAIISILTVKEDLEAKGSCEQDGGQVLEVRGGRGGWVCVKPVRLER